tara:strand:- start:2931 stop:3182 length:252 start_codon:yes stop_codon:yes gene_type:complete
MSLIWTSLGFLRSGVGKVLVGGVFVVLVILTVFKAGVNKQKQKNLIEDLTDYKETRKDIDDATKDSPNDYDAAREFLRNRRDK